jgi:RNA-directed DNA polymerase
MSMTISNDGKKINKSLRYAEYYDMTEIFDKLYADSLNNKKFNNLMNIIKSEENIKLAYRNIKRNTVG